MTDLPHGTVAFLFTDVAGSTRLWQSHRAAMERAYTRHDALLRGAIAAQRGVVYKVVGDAFQVAFPTVPEAVAAALGSQRALVSEDWTAVGLPEPLRIRMALHVGEVDPDPDGDYRSPVLNRVGRLLGAGHGGQVLLSQAVVERLGDALPPHATLLDLGERRLKDLQGGERISQLLHPELPTDFPPLLTLDRRPHNLPVQPTPLLGRESEIRTIRHLLERRDGGSRLVTLLGPGGIGKTRLALQMAAELVDVFNHGAFWVELAPLTDAALVPAAIAGVLGVAEEGGRPVVESLTEHLREQELLLVLDNLEQLVGVAPLLATLLAAAPGLRILATSRERLGVRGERLAPVEPLGVPPRQVMPRLDADSASQYAAVQLFCQRAEALKPDFALTDATARPVAEICHRLDGLPLAIELAAARIRLFPPPVLLARLEQRLPVLTGGARDLPERQQTLRNAIAWSHDLLAPDEQALFRRLAVFAGGASFEAVEAVANADGALDVFTQLASLVDKSLVRQRDEEGDEPRFVMLETIREFGVEQLAASGDDEAVRRGHSQFFLDLTEAAEPQLRGPNQRSWLERLETEHDNIRAALGWMLEHAPPHAQRMAGSLHRFWSYRGHFEEGRAWLERTLTACSEVSLARVSALHGAGLLADRQGDYGSAKVLQEASLALAQTIDDRQGEAKALLALSVLAGSAGDTVREVCLAEESLAVSRRLGDSLRMASALANVGYGAYGRGEFERAAVLLDEGLNLAREVGDWLLVGLILDSQGAVAQARGDLAQAATSYHEALRLAAEIGNQTDVAGYLSAVASLAVVGGQIEAAVRLWGAAASITEMLGTPVPPEEQGRHAQPMVTARSQLGDVAFAGAYEAGWALPGDQAVAEALALADELASKPSHA